MFFIQLKLYAQKFNSDFDKGKTVRLQWLRRINK